MNRRRKSVLKSLAASSLVLVVSACAFGPPTPDLDYKLGYDFGNAKTVAFFEESGFVSGDNPLQVSDIQRLRINEAIRMEIETKGLSFVDSPEKADLLLSWHLNTQHQTDIRTYNNSGGYPGFYGGFRSSFYGGYNRFSRYNSFSHYNNFGRGFSDTDVSVKNYTQGTFILDFIDPVAKKSVWRGVTESRLKGKQERDQMIYNEAATAILAAYPPQKDAG